MVVRTLALFAMLGVLPVVASCGSTSYDDCILESVKDTTSESAVTTIQQSCQRKFESDTSGELEIQAQDVKLSLKDLEMPPRYILTNSGSGIVTQAEVTSPQGSWTVNVWLEPGRWEAQDAPVDEAKDFMSHVRSGQVEAKKIREIPGS